MEKAASSKSVGGNPISMRYLANVWGVCEKYPARLMKERPSEPARNCASPVNLPVISSLAAAKVKYSPRNMYIASRMRERKLAETQFAFDNNNQSMSYTYREEAKAEWCLMSDSRKSYWEHRARSQIAAQLERSRICVERDNPMSPHLRMIMVLHLVIRYL